jgi:hypothetical protein
MVPWFAAAEPFIGDARGLREEAADAYTKGDFATCVKKAHDALAIGKEPQTVGLLGMCEAESHEWRDAAEDLDYALQFDPNEERKARYKPKLAEAKTHVGEIIVTATPEACSIRLDEKDKGNAPKSLFVSAGHYAIEVTRSGYQSQRIEVDVRGDETKPVKVELIPESSNHPSTARPLWPVAVGYGFGALGLAVGAGLAGAANAAAPGANCASACDDARRTQNRLSYGSLWTFVAGGTFALATTGYLIWAVTGRETKAPSTTGFLVTPFASPWASGAIISKGF